VTIKPCPFCGSERAAYVEMDPESPRGAYRARYVCGCGAAGPSVPFANSKAETDTAARFAWNDRAEVAAQ
jgi:Lar family restriction alleviation protein